MVYLIFKSRRCYRILLSMKLISISGNSFIYFEVYCEEVCEQRHVMLVM